MIGGVRAVPSDLPALPTSAASQVETAGSEKDTLNQPVNDIIIDMIINSVRNTWILTLHHIRCCRATPGFKPVGCRFGFLSTKVSVSAFRLSTVWLSALVSSMEEKPVS